MSRYEKTTIKKGALVKFINEVKVVFVENGNFLMNRPETVFVYLGENKLLDKNKILEIGRLKGMEIIRGEREFYTIKNFETNEWDEPLQQGRQELLIYRKPDSWEPERWLEKI